MVELLSLPFVIRMVVAVGALDLNSQEDPRRLGCDQKDMRRLLDPRHASKIGTIADALRILGKALILDVRDAA